MPKLIFIYNANSGIGNTLLDVAHKILSPKTYKCNLCSLTFDTFSENKAWKAFRQQSIIDMEFLHCDEFERKYKNTDVTYPVILSQKSQKLVIFLSTDSIKNTSNIDVLISNIKTKLKLTTRSD